MHERILTTRMSIRCTEDERDRIGSIADSLDLTVSDFFRQAAVIATAKTTDLASWRRVYVKAINNVTERKLWITT